MARKKAARSKDKATERAVSAGKRKPSSEPKAAAAAPEAQEAGPARRRVEAGAGKPGKFPIVGIGASAGGLEAFEEFFRAMPPASGMGFVLVAHLDPTHVSILPDLVQKHTPMPVHQAQDGMAVRPNSVYVIPPNRELCILNGVLQLLEPTQPRRANLPIDSFFRSLARDQGPSAICVILSGTGTDGTLGIKAVKGELGMVMVQDERSAKYDGMPRSAIATGLADYVLPPEKMPQQLVKYTRHAAGRAGAAVVPAEGEVPNALQKIFVLLRARTNHDFSLYKRNTIYRRIERRMSVHQIDDIADYVRYLQESGREAGILFKELLIGVTSFFRDPGAFDALRTKGLSDLLKGRPGEPTIRVWVPGCSSGEEAYSIAILLQEYQEALGRHFNVQIFGTDIDEDAIALARAGVYPASIAVDVGPERLGRYFTKDDSGHYRIKKSIREMLVFARQNIIKDPPFTKLDLLSCRNLLIYLGAELQKKLLPIFHYSLSPGGILMLGSSETIGQATDLFSTIDRKWKMFRRRPASAGPRAMLDFPTALTVDQTPRGEPSDTVRQAEELSAIQLVETILQQSDAPPCAIIDDLSNVVYVHGRTGSFLEPAEGKVSVNIVEMARPGLKAALAAAIREVTIHKQEVIQKELRVEHNGGRLLVDLTVKPILELESVRGLMMVMFQEVAAPDKSPKPKRRSRRPGRAARTAEELEQELQHTRENLQTTIEELETSNEELKSTNEELQSTNEELQSTNEEMETSKEELQSLNEESATVNAELQSRIDELSMANDDLKNLLDSTEIATIFLDRDLRVRLFTPKATQIIPLAASDGGRPIGHFAPRLIDVDLAGCAKAVLDDLGTQEREARTRDGLWFIMRARPYRTTGNLIDGVVITFSDITERKRIEDGLTVRLASVVRDSNDAITLLERDGRIAAWNTGAERMYGYTEEEAVGMSITDIVPEASKREALSLVESVFEGRPVESLKAKRLTKDGRVLDVWLTVTVLSDGCGNPSQVATTERDITGWKP